MRTTDQSHAQFAPSAASDSDSESMRRSRPGPSLQINLLPRANRVGTLRGIPRLFVLRRAFCLSWAFSVAVFIYLKWYFPLYLSSTVSRNTLKDFGKDWCRVRRARIDWGRIREPCEGNTVFEESLPGWNVENRTDSLYSLIYAMDIRPAGEFSRLTIKTRTSDGDPKMIGGDYWRVFIDGPSGLAPTVIDHGNGSYEVLFLIVEHGEYCMYAVLDHSLCDGIKDPPDFWYTSGNVHGSNQPEGILGGKQVYLMSPLRGGQPICFNVPPNDGPMRKDEFLSYGFGLPSYCAPKCKFLSDGFGYWINDTWIPYTAERLFENSPRRKEGILWIYGDSLAVRFHASISKTPLCTEIFKQCDVTYNWVYNMVDVVNVERNKKNYREFDISRVLHEISKVIHRPEMDEKSVIILNCGLHYVSALQFSTYKLLIDSIINLFQETTENQYGDEVLKYKGKLIWKTTTAIHRERFLYHNHPSPRFLTLQRIQLYNAYSTWAMCNAGFEILDVYPMSASYPEGTDDRFDKYDAVHFKTIVFKPAEQLLFDYFHPSDREDSDHSSHSEPQLSQ